MLLPMTIALTFAALVAFVAPVQQPTVNSLTPAQKQQIDQLIVPFMLAGKTTAVEVAVQKNGKTVFECGYGTISQNSKVAPGANTHFQIDSLTKSFTAFAILKLAEQGKLDIDQPFSKYIKPVSPNWNAITIRQLLGMVSGIPDGGTMTGTYQQVIAKAAQKTGNYKKGLDFQPGSKYEYSNNNYFILGEIVNALSPQKNFMEYCKAEILEPLQMEETGFISFGTGELWPTPTINGNAVKPRIPMSGFTGGGFTTTMSDLELFGAGLYNQSILTAATYKDMWTPTVLTTGPNKGQNVVFGLGWDVALGPLGKVTLVSKNGGGYGWGAQLDYFPQTGVCVILLRNSSGGGAIGAVTKQIGQVVK